MRSGELPASRYIPHVEISSREFEGIAIFELKGRLTLDSGDRLFREAVDRAQHAGNKRLLVDLGGVTVLDSSGLGELISARMAAGRRGASVKLLHLPQKAQDVSQIAQLIRHFDVFDDEAAALASFR